MHCAGSNTYTFRCVHCPGTNGGLWGVLGAPRTTRDPRTRARLAAGWASTRDGSKTGPSERASLLDERVGEHAGDADAAAEHLDWLDALAESDGHADDDDDALGGVGDALRRGGGGLEELHELAQLGALGEQEDRQDAEGAEEGRQ